MSSRSKYRDFFIIFVCIFLIQVSFVFSAGSSVNVTQEILPNSTGNGGDGGFPPPTQQCQTLPAEAQILSCAPDQQGTIVQTRVSSCPGPVWSGWITTSDTCQPIPPEPLCDPLPTQTRTLSCPQGETGSITEVRTSMCPGPVWSSWNTALNTCSAPPPICTGAGCVEPPPPPPQCVGAGCQVGGGGEGGGGGFFGTTTATTTIPRIVNNAVNFITDITKKSFDVAKQSVDATSKFVKSPTGQISSNIVKAVGVVAVAVAAGSQAVAISLSIGSINDLYLLLLKILGAGLGFLRKKKRPWGTVYDSVTKRPLDPAYVVIKREDGSELSDAITDLDGRYGFLLSAGTYFLSAQKTNYIFPSKMLANKTGDELYDNLYFGEPVVTQEGEVIVRNIPMDPVAFDWNEFAKNKQALFRLHSQREQLRGRIYNVLFGVGFFATLVTTLLDIRPYNFIFLTIYLGSVVYQVFWAPSHKARTLSYDSGEPLSYAIVRVYLQGVEKPVRSVVTDQLGRFYMLVAPGSYYITVDEKMLDGSYGRVYQSEVMNLSKGVLKRDVVIRRMAKY